MNVDNLCVNTLRILSAEGVQKANSGHPGLPMGSAPMAYALWAKHLKHNPKNPGWVDRDRFVLSAGHGSMLLYSLLHVFGYDVSIDDLKNFRQFGSKTAGHPEHGHTPGVETTTGPLGQGVANAVGMAMTEAHLAATFNQPNYEVVNHYTYTLMGDGCMMEGITSEACSLAGTLKLGKLIAFYDSNKITIEGSTDIAFTEDVAKRFDAYHWHVQIIEDGNDVEAISVAIEKAKAVADKPSLIIVKTIIGYGCPERQGKASAHGEPLGEDNIACTKANLGFPPDESFYVPTEVKTHMNSIVAKGEQAEQAWDELFSGYCKTFPELAKQWDIYFNSALPIDLTQDEAFFTFAGKNATRNSSYEVLNRLCKVIPNFFGGSADLAPSNKTYMKDMGDFFPGCYEGKNLHFGVREFAMASAANGMALHGGVRPYVATFFVFSDYMKHSMRLSALMKLPVVYVLTHDSIGVGEDGPTHEPIEQLIAARSIPGFTVIRPADSKETAAGWLLALTRKGPTALVLTRQNLPLYEGTGMNVQKGAYILSDSKKVVPDVILMASGSEVEQIMEAQKVLREKGVDARVISMPSWELFEEQSPDYQESVLPKAVRVRVAVEAGSPMGWHKYVGLDGKVIAMETFGASGPADVLFKHFGFTVDNVVQTTLSVIK